MCSRRRQSSRHIVVVVVKRQNRHRELCSWICASLDVCERTSHVYEWMDMRMYLCVGLYSVDLGRIHTSTMILWTTYPACV